MNPWEKYGGTATAEAPAAGPWQKYAGPAKVTSIDARGPKITLTGRDSRDPRNPKSPYYKPRGEQMLDVAEGIGAAGAVGPLAAGLVTAPAATLLGVAGGAAAQYGGKKAATAMGAGPTAARAVGDVAGLAGGALAIRIPGAARAAGKFYDSLTDTQTTHIDHPAPQPKLTDTHAEVKGNTFPVRDQLRELGAEWNKTKKAWFVPKEKLQRAQDIVAKVPEVKGVEGYRSRGERNLEELSAPGRGPLKSPSQATTSPKGQADAIAGVLKKLGTSRADAANMSELEWILVFSNAKLKEIPDPKVLKAALSQLQ